MRTANVAPSFIINETMGTIPPVLCAADVFIMVSTQIVLSVMTAPALRRRERSAGVMGRPPYMQSRSAPGSRGTAQLPSNSRSRRVKTPPTILSMQCPENKEKRRMPMPLLFSYKIYTGRGQRITRSEPADDAPRIMRINSIAINNTEPPSN